MDSVARGVTAVVVGSGALFGALDSSGDLMQSVRQTNAYNELNECQDTCSAKPDFSSVAPSE